MAVRGEYIKSMEKAFRILEEKGHLTVAERLEVSSMFGNSKATSSEMIDEQEERVMK